MKSQCIAIFGLGILIVLSSQSQSNANTLYAEWSNPVFVGNVADGATGILAPQDNAGTAVYSITSSSTPNDTISWGTYTAPNCAAILPTSCASTITFTGNTVPANPSVPFQLGTITYTNGTSDLNSLLFGATLTFYQTGSPNPIGSDFVGFATTSNTGTAAQNADYITFSGLANTSFNVYEGATAIGGLDGFIDALVLTGITVDASQAANGFVSNSPALPVPGPLAGAGLPGLVFASSLLAWLRVRRRRG